MKYDITFLTPTLKLSGGNLVMIKYAEYFAQNGYNVCIVAPNDKKQEYFINGVLYKTFKRKIERKIELIFFQLIYLKDFYETIPQTNILMPIFTPLIIHSIYAKIKYKIDKIILLSQDSNQMYWFGWYINMILKFKFLTNKIDKIIVISDPLAKFIQINTNRYPDRVKNGIDDEFFYQNKEKIEKDYILFSGSNKKGLKYFIEAIKIVVKKYPNIKIKIISEEKVHLNHSNIEIYKYIQNRKTLASFYKNALIYVSQSLGDTFGLPPLEAMACGTATILTDTLGSSEYAVNMFNSIVVPMRSPKKTAIAIIELIENTELRLKLEKNGIKTAQNYHWETSFKKMENILFN